MAVVKTESLFFTPMPSLLEKPSRIQSADQNELTEIAYDMIDLAEDFATDFQEFKTITAERIEPLYRAPDKIEPLIWENFTGHDTVQTIHMKQQVELLQNESIRLRMKSESLLKVTEFLSAEKGYIEYALI